MLADPVAEILRAPPGSALWGILTLPGEARAAAILAREDREGMRTYPMPCPVAHRLQAWEIDGVLVVAWLARLNGRDAATFECWANPCEPTAREALELLSAQPHLDVHLFVAGTKPARSVRSPNYLHRAATDLLAKASSMPPWPMQAFDAARAKIYAKHPTVRELWAAGDNPE